MPHCTQGGGYSYESISIRLRFDAVRLSFDDESQSNGSCNYSGLCGGLRFPNASIVVRRLLLHYLLSVHH